MRLLLLLVFALACASSAPPPEPEVAPGGVSTQVERAEDALAAGDLDAAIAEYSAALEKTPWNERLEGALAASYGERAAQHRANKSLPKAERDLRSGLDLSPDDEMLRHNLALVLAERAALEMDPDRASRMRAEALELSPDVASAIPQRRADIERRLDLAYELIERGQLEAGIERLERLHADAPTAMVTQLLAAAEVRMANRLADRENYEDAGHALDRAVELYADLDNCFENAGGCTRDEVKLAHHNRIVAWGQVDPARAKAAKAQAKLLGFRFSELR